jgi:hypothetical protein
MLTHLAVLTLITLTATPAVSTASVSTVVIVRPEATDTMLLESFSRLCGELHMYGLKFIVVDGGGPGSSQPGPAARFGPDAAGVVTLLRTPGRVSARIWIAEPASPQESSEITVSIDDADAANLLAIRAADVLRATLRRESAGAEPIPGGRTAAAVGADFGLADLPWDAADPWDLRIGATTLWEVGTLGPGFAPSIEGERRIARRLGVAVMLAAPMAGQSYQSVAASATLRQELATLALSLRVVCGRRINLDVLPSVGAVHLAVRGEASYPWIAQSSSAWAAALSAGSRVELRLTRHLGLDLGLAALWLLPSPVLEVAGASYRMREPQLLATGSIGYGL